MTTSQSQSARMYWLHAVTPLHVGSGRGVGFIDLPVMREAVTNWPYVPGSAFKGVLTDENQATPEDRKDPTKHKIRAAFGVLDDQDEPQKKTGIAGSLVFTDARLVCMPVRSLYGTFAWCTSQLALERLKRDLDQVHVARTPTHVPNDEELKQNLIRVTPESVLHDNHNVFFEDLDFSVQQHTDKSKPDRTNEWAEFLASAVFGDQSPWRTEFKRRFAIVKNDVFDFLTQTATEVVARISIDDDTKIVKDGALWYEESLPAESILAGCVWCDKVFGAQGSGLKPSDLLDEFCKTKPEKERVWQLGGKASVGRGRVRCVFQD